MILGSIKDEKVLTYLQEHASDFVVNNETEAENMLAIAQRNVDDLFTKYSEAERNLEAARNNYEYWNKRHIRGANTSQWNQAKKDYNEWKERVDAAKTYYEEAQIIAYCWGYTLDLLRNQADIATTATYEENQRRYKESVKEINKDIENLKLQTELEKSRYLEEREKYQQLLNELGEQDSIVQEKKKLLEQYYDMATELQAELDAMKDFTPESGKITTSSSGSGLLDSAKNFYQNNKKIVLLAAAGLALFWILGDNND